MFPGTKRWKRMREQKRLEKCTKNTHGYLNMTGLCKVIEVHDAGTCTVLYFLPGMRIPMRVLVHLYGIDAPEMQDMESQDRYIDHRPIHARNALRAMVLDVVCQYTNHGEDESGYALFSLQLPNGDDVVTNLLLHNHGVPYYGGKKRFLTYC